MQALTTPKKLTDLTNEELNVLIDQLEEGCQMFLHTFQNIGKAMKVQDLQAACIDIIMERKGIKL
jgi:hypothetical protein